MIRRKRQLSEVNRFWAKVQQDANGCWNWTAFKLRGYGRFRRGNHNGVYPVVFAHRFSFELTNGPIPSELVIDHLCRNPACVNPSHLEAVTPQTNTLRGVGPAAINAKKTHCPKGHKYSPENTIIEWRHGHSIKVRVCRLCKNVKTRKQARRRRLREVAAWA